MLVRVPEPSSADLAERFDFASAVAWLSSLCDYTEMKHLLISSLYTVLSQEHVPAFAPYAAADLEV